MPRSGMSLDGINVIPGVIDQDYDGIISIIVTNNSLNMYSLLPERAMAQIIFKPAPNVSIEEVDSIPKTKQGMKAFSSTDNQTLAADVKVLKKLQE